MLQLHDMLLVACFQTGCDVTEVSTHLYRQQPDNCQTGHTINDLTSFQQVHGGKKHIAKVSLVLKHVHVGQTFKSCKNNQSSFLNAWELARHYIE